MSIGRTYAGMLLHYVFPAIARIYQRFGIGFDGIWWMQDGAPAHRTVMVRIVLRQKFQNRIVALIHGIEWPPRSPDLTLCDFFSLGLFEKKSVFV